MYLEGSSVNETMIPITSETEEVHVKFLQMGSGPKFSKEEWAVKQCEDPEIGIVYQMVKGN